MPTSQIPPPHGVHWTADFPRIFPTPSPVFCFSTHHMMKRTIIIIASFKVEKNSTSGLPFSRSFPSTMPNTMENTVSPRMFIPPDDVIPAGTVSAPACTSFLMVVMLMVPLVWTAVIFSSASS